MTTADKTMTSLGRRTVLAMAVSAIGLAGAARAQAADLVDLTVVDRETGQPLRPWPHDRRLFVAGQPGARYSLRITNNSGGRVLVVMSVDGVNIVSGETAGYGQTGYVLRPYESYDVSGWRKSDTEVAAFVFASLSQSYAARTGRPGDVGVIGVAAFREKVYVPPPVASISRSSPNTIEEMVVTGQDRRAAPPPVAHRLEEPAAPARQPESAAVLAERRAEKLGTAHGAREWSAVTNVEFERASRYPQLIRRIEYDSYANLVALGVIRPSWERGRPPRAFPGSDGRYVPDPPGGR